ncbi:MAG TPA: acetyl-CoA hydrolase/transferase C-terminal domain-containing protein [Xanthobacteraceae bacterium]|nr:acetyl-CoA hydrolase/transferase C-terminal domain-containing protein [Xanthobacteraceae bacterium]
MKTLPLEQIPFSTIVRASDVVAWGQGAAEPEALTAELLRCRHRIGAFEAFIGMSYGQTPQLDHCDTVKFSSYCATGNNRKLSEADRLEIYPCHYSSLTDLLKARVRVLLLQVAPTDRQDIYSLSLAQDYLAPLVKSAAVVIAEINDKAPATFGETEIHTSDIDYAVLTSRTPITAGGSRGGDPERRIAEIIASLIDDGMTVQTGLGAIPELVIEKLSSHRDLGVHSGIIGDQIGNLMKSGAVTNARKSIDRGVTVTGQIFGSADLYEFTDRNPAISVRSINYTHAPSVLCQLEKFAAINAAIEVDLTGQINAEMAGGRYVGAVGGAMDFIRAARASPGGLPIIALPSVVRTQSGLQSRIVASLNGPVSTPRADAAVIVTEHGYADLRALSLRERAKALISIAAPEFRESLDREFMLGA